ncbi:MAG: LPS assembly lipoprotein LptE [Pseudomonadota bacterium]
MLIKRRFALTLTLTAVMMLSACGFQLRGSGPQANLPFKTIHVGLPDTSSLGKELRRYINGTGMSVVVDDAKKAEASIDVLSEARDRVVLSLNSQGRVREYTLNYRLSFRVIDDKGAVLLAPTDLIVSRVLTYNEAQALAKEAEEAALYRDMQNDLVQQMLRRLAAIKPGLDQPGLDKPAVAQPAK